MKVFGSLSAPLLLVLSLTRLSVSDAADKNFACADYCYNGELCRMQCAPATCNPTQGKIEGSMLFMDISGDDVNRSPAVTPLGCCAACEITDGCKAWVLCTNPNGCGSGCKANTVPNGNDVDASKRLGALHSCTDDDKYPYQMCSLNTGSGGNTPRRDPVDGVKEGWVSGTVKPRPPKDCPPRISPGNCNMCKATKSVHQCLSCVKSRKQVGLKVDCGLCASLKTEEQRTACFKVAFTPGRFSQIGSECRGGDFATLSTAGDLQICFDELYERCRASKHPATCSRCIRKAGAKTGCVACANMPDPTSRAQCTSCVEGGNRYNCESCIDSTTGWPTAHAAACFSCQAKTKGPAKQECYSCQQATVPSLCYKCVQGTGNFKQVPGHARSACRHLSDQGPAAGDHAAAVACLKSTASDTDGTEGCSLCLQFSFGKSVKGCLEAVPKQATGVGKRNTFKCILPEGGIGKKCVECVGGAADDDAVFQCQAAASG